MTQTHYEVIERLSFNKLGTIIKTFSNSHEAMKYIFANKSLNRPFVRRITVTTLWDSEATIEAKAS